MTADDDCDGPAFPAAVRLAGAVWLGQGGVSLAVALGLAVRSLAPDGGPMMCGAIPLAALGFPLVWYGSQVLSARGDDVAGVAAATLLLAACVGVLGVGPWVGAGRPPGSDRVVASVAGGSAVALAFPGALALAGRRQYLTWRAYHRPGGRS